jgi:hypothetical protein
VDLISHRLHKIVIGGTRERIARILQGRTSEKNLGRLGRSNYTFRSLQLPIQILKGVAKVILLFGNQGGVPEAINSLYEAAHYSISPCNRPTKARLDCFTLVFEIPVFRIFDPRTILCQKFSQSLERRPSSPSALSIGFEFVQ